MATTTDMHRTELLEQLEQEIGVMIRRIRRVIGERARAVHPELQSSSYLVLSWLEQHDSVRLSAIAEMFGIDKGAISRQVQHLLDLGLVNRAPDPADGRAALISASADAIARMHAVKQDQQVGLGDRLGDWSDADLADFVGLLGRYNLSLDGHVQERVAVG